MSFSDDFGESFGEGFDGRMKTMMESLEERLRKIGLYLDSGHVHPAQEPVPGNPIDKLMVVATFTIGDLAWSDKVQDPERAGMNRQGREITDDLEQQKWDEMGRLYREGKLRTDFTEPGEEG